MLNSFRFQTSHEKDANLHETLHQFRITSGR
jgi:hypothetical protein